MILRNPQMLWLLPVLLVVLLVAQRGIRGGMTLLLRMLLLTAIVVALADPIRPGTLQPPPLVVLVDGSSSVTPERRAAAWQAAQAIAAQHGTGQTTLASFGRDVRVASDDRMPEVDGTATDIAGALRLTAGLLGNSGSKAAPNSHVVIISDGAATTPGAEAAAATMRDAGISVDVLPLAPDERLDVQVAEINVPAGLREGQNFRGDIVLSATAPTSVTLDFQQDDEPVTTQDVTVTTGRTTVPFAGVAGRSGIHQLRAEVRIADAHIENNAVATAMVVGPAPHVLVIERQPDSAAHLRDLLEQGGIQSEARRPADLPSNLSELERFDAIILQDVSADSLQTAQQTTLRDYVRSLGHGLLVLGGSNSYGLGNYKGTPLEEVLPVSSEAPPHRERQAVALLLIIDHSASMYGKDPHTSKLELAKGAAIAATQALVPEDRVGVLAFDSQTEWTVPFTNIGEKQSLTQIQDNIARLSFGGGTDIYQALATGLPELAAQGSKGNISAKHAVLLTDGRSYGDTPDYDRLVATARQNGITLSTIAIGDDADKDLLKHVAERGQGRYYFAADPQDLPRLTLQETELARDDPKVQAEVQPQPRLGSGIQAHPVLRGFVPRQFPTIEGYVATTLKPSADMILQSAEGDTILAGWQYGLGRALAWTSDSGEQWANKWQTWTDSMSFWTQTLAYTFPDPTMGPLQTRVEPDQQGARVVAEAKDQNGLPLDLGNVAVRVLTPSNTEDVLRLKQVAPGRYEARLPTIGPTLQPGSYRLSSALQKGDLQLEAFGTWNQPIQAEFSGPSSDPAQLARIAQAGGGTVLSTPEDAVANFTAAPHRDPIPLWPWLAGVAALLWPLEIAVRRGWFRRA